MAVLLNIPFEAVEIIVEPDGSSGGGAIVYGPEGSRRFRGSRGDSAFVDGLDAHLRVYLAGKIAEDLAAEQQAAGPRTPPPSWLAGMEGDRQNIVRMLDALHPRDEAAQHCRCDVAIASCRDQLRAFWSAVEAVATALVQQRRVISSQVRAIVRARGGKS
ncbi:MAG TPA: hypothetical protein VKZ50_04635 [bacterium]|nr:hypothetical protein [bacterium]